MTTVPEQWAEQARYDLDTAQAHVGQRSIALRPVLLPAGCREDAQRRDRETDERVPAAAAQPDVAGGTCRTGDRGGTIEFLGESLELLHSDAISGRD